MKILLAGGGTMGSVSPLIAVYEEAQAQKKKWDWLWVGTYSGAEREIVRSLCMPYEWVPSSKLRRYFSLSTFVEPFFLILAFFRSLLIISSTKPDVVIGAGSFVSVPVIWAAWCFRKKIFIHQQDIRPTLSNKLCAWCASRITVSFEKSLKDYPAPKAEWTGNLVRNAVFNARADVAKRSFRLDPALPTLLITGGSSGAVGINEWVFEHVQELCEHANVVHLTGKSKGDPDVSHQRYHQEEFLHGDMFHMMAASDVIISRAGISTISELAAIGKAAVIVPMPKTHQEENAFFVARSHAARVFRQDQMNERFMDEVLRLLSRKDARAELEKQLQSLAKPAARQRYIALIETSNQHAAPEI